MGLPQAFFPALQPSGLGSRKEDGLPFILEPEEKVVRYTLLYVPVIRSFRDPCTLLIKGTCFKGQRKSL